MNHKSTIQKNLLQLIAIVLGAAILTTLTQRSFNSIGTAIDATESRLLSKSNNN